MLHPRDVPPTPVLRLLLSGPSGGVWSSSVVLWSVGAAL